MRESRRILLAALAAELLVLVVTGVFLVFRYQPSGGNAWNDIEAFHHSTSLADVVREIHRWASFLCVWTALATGVVVVSDAWGHRRSDIAIGTALVPVALFGAFSGYLLPWDQLGLWAVTVGSKYQGYSPVWGHKTRFVLFGHTEVGNGTMLRWLLVHSLVFGPLLAGLVVVVVRRSGRRDAEQGSGVVADEGGAA